MNSPFVLHLFIPRHQKCIAGLILQRPRAGVAWNPQGFTGKTWWFHQQNTGIWPKKLLGVNKWRSQLLSAYDFCCLNPILESPKPPTVLPGHQLSLNMFESFISRPIHRATSTCIFMIAPLKTPMMVDCNLWELGVSNPIDGFYPKAGWLNTDQWWVII